MTQFSKVSAFALITLGVLFGCQQEEVPSLKPVVSDEVLAQIGAMGFGTKGVQKVDEGYLVEGDIILTDENLRNGFNGKALRIAEVEQYRTTNTVAVSGSRVIKVAIDNKIPSSYGPALDEVVRRYNAENLTITLQRVTTGADITFVNANGSYLASAGFPTSTGDPYNQVKVNTRAIGTGTSSTFINYAATILAHELGHCIGFRHTDYMDRSYSCGGSTSNEGASTVGAILIPGTPSGPDAGSWMLACIGNGVNRNFNNNDKTALNFLY